MRVLVPNGDVSRSSFTSGFQYTGLSGVRKFELSNGTDGLGYGGIGGHSSCADAIPVLPRATAATDAATTAACAKWRVRGLVIYRE